MGFQQIMGLVLGVLVFIAVLGGFAYLSKRVSGGAALSGRRMKVLDRTMLTRDSYVLLVQIGLRILAVGVGKGAPALLCELSPSDFPEFAKKTAGERKDPGFWGRFASNIKAGFTGKSVVQPEEEASFSDILQQIAEKDPVPGEEVAGDAGYPHLWEAERRPAPPRFGRRVNYQSSIENMNRLSEPDMLDRRARFYSGPDKTPPRRDPAPSAPPSPHVPPPELPRSAAAEEERTERIDQLLDLIAQRQSRMDGRNNTGDMG
jgi:flagellar biogenesis protein FliO